MGRVFSAAGSISCLKTYLTASKSTNLAQILVLSCSPPASLPDNKYPATRSSNPPQSFKCQGLSLIRGSKNDSVMLYPWPLFSWTKRGETMGGTPWERLKASTGCRASLLPGLAGAGGTRQFLAACMASSCMAEPLLPRQLANCCSGRMKWEKLQPCKQLPAANA